MFPTTGADPGITITHTQPGISVLASGFTSGVTGGDFSQSFMVDTTDPDPLAHPRGVRQPARRDWGATVDCRTDRSTIVEQTTGAPILSVPGIAKALDLAAPETIQLAPLTGASVVAFPSTTGTGSEPVHPNAGDAAQ
jgi:hypothetical protein